MHLRFLFLNVKIQENERNEKMDKKIHFVNERLKYLRLRRNVMHNKYLQEILWRTSRVSQQTRMEVYDFVDRYSYLKNDNPDTQFFIRQFIKKMPALNRLLLVTDYGYKFTKSDIKYTDLFAENHYKPYIPGSVMKRNENEHPFSFTGDPVVALSAAIYGDQLTLVKIPGLYSNPYAKNMHLVYKNSQWDIYETDELAVEQNYSMKDTRVVLYLLKMYYSYPDNVFIPYQVQDMFLKGLSLIDVYRRIGFDESADLLRDVSAVYEKEKMVGLRQWINAQSEKYGVLDIPKAF